MRTKARALKAESTIERVAAILQGYADRAVFRGFSRGPVRGGRTVFKITWHRDRLFELILDTRKRTLHFPHLLPEVPPAMYQEFRRYLESRSSKTVPAHRRIDPKRATVRCANRRGNVSLTLQVLTGDYAYGTRKFIHLVHEIYLQFLGEYFDYQVEAFDLDPDHP